MYDIITFGSASRDIFLKPKSSKVVKGKSFITGKGVCFNLGSKIEVEDMFLSSGGGGTNSAATFTKQGLKTAYCGKVGDDLAGEEIIDELKKLKIDTNLISKTNAKPTNHSVVLSGMDTDRTIFVFRGASELLCGCDIPWDKLKTKWFYLAPLSGEVCNISKDLIDFASRRKIKVAFNPGNSQLCLSMSVLKDILKRVDILILNQEEASLLTGIPYKEEVSLFKKIDELCPGISIMTKGSRGVVVSDGKHLYRALPTESKIVDRTGAGDSFGAGFVSGFLQSEGDIEYAIQLGTANSSSCLSKWGAKEGLLKKGEKFKKTTVEKESCLKNNFCQIKK